jgi:hypothetical protein
MLSEVTHEGLRAGSGRRDGRAEVLRCLHVRKLMDQLAESRKEAEQRCIASGFAAAVDASQAALARARGAKISKSAN